MNISQSRSAFQEARALAILPFRRDRRLSPGLIDVPSRHVLHEAGTRSGALHRIVSGDVMVTMSGPRGMQAIVALLGRGDLVGLGLDGQHFCTAQALTPLSLQYIEKESALDIQIQLSRQLRASLQRAAALTTLTALERFADFLVLWAERQMADGQLSTCDLDSAFDLFVPIQRGELAKYLAMTGETVSRSLAELRNRRLIETPRPTTISILDFRGLASLCR